LILACIYDCLRFLVGLLALKLGGGDREVELLLVRHELSVLRRTVKKPRLNAADRMILAALAMKLPRRAWGGLLVRPETVLGWHRALVHRRWAAFGRRLQLHPPNGPLYPVSAIGAIRCRSRLGGLLREYSRAPNVAAA